VVPSTFGANVSVYGFGVHGTRVCRFCSHQRHALPRALPFPASALFCLPLADTGAIRRPAGEANMSTASMFSGYSGFFYPLAE
jgi:hypothetical protein